jgi:hypothetical protein
MSDTPVAISAVVTPDSLLKELIMMTSMNRVLAAALCAAGMTSSLPAAAYDEYGNKHRHWHKHSHSQHYRHAHERVFTERVYVERPVYVERYVQYVPPPPPRSPAIVVSVDIPPLVFPLR